MTLTIEEHIENIPEMADYFSNVVMFVRYCQQNNIEYSNNPKNYPIEALQHIEEIPNFFPQMIDLLVAEFSNEDSFLSFDDDTTYMIITKLSPEDYCRQHKLLLSKPQFIRPSEMKEITFEQLKTGNLILTLSHPVAEEKEEEFENLSESVLLDAQEYSVKKSKKKQENCLIQ